MKYRRKLLFYPDVYDAPGSEALFLFAMREITAWHILHCPEYAKIVRRQGFKLKSLRTTADLHRIPALPTLFLKKRTLYSMPEEKIVIRATTSGTSGRKSEVGTDLDSGLHEVDMAFRTLLRHHMVSPCPTNYIILGYQPSKHNQSGVMRTAFAFTLVAPALHRAYALKDTGDAYTVDIDGLINTLLRYEKQGFPVRLMGLPAYHHLLLTTLQERGICIKLHPASYLCMGGGWKQFYFEHADKGELYALAQAVLGIPESRCIDFYGAVEHPVLYCDCKNHHFHIPAFSRVIIRDTHTLKPVANGRPGIINLLSPLMRSMPLHSIMTDDLAILREGHECGCGNPAPWFELLGRAGMRDLKTCAAGAAEYLQGAAP